MNRHRNEGVLDRILVMKTLFFMKRSIQWLYPGDIPKHCLKKNLTDGTFLVAEVEVINGGSVAE